MSKNLNLSNFYIFLWCLYNLQGSLYASGSIISQGILAILLLISLYYTVYANVNYQLPPYMKMLNAMLVMFTIYGVVLIISGEELIIKEECAGVVSNKDYLKNIYMSLLPIYTFFVFAKIGELTEVTIRRWIPIFLIIIVANFFARQQELLAMAVETLSIREEFTNNTGYIFLSIIPMLLFVKRPFVQYLLLLLCMIFIVAAMKRGAILILIISLPFFFHSTLSGISLVKKLLVFVLIATSAFVAVYYVSYMMDTSDYFNTRIDQTIGGDASNREDIYPHLLRQIFYYATPLQFLFGRGAWGSLKVSDNFAHNDWLEIGVNQGMLGVAMYLMYWVSFWISAKNFKKNTMVRKVLTILMVILFAKTMFSMSYDSMPIYMTLCIGYCMSHYKNDTLLCER